MIFEISAVVVLWILSYFAIRKLINKIAYFFGTGLLLLIAGYSIYEKYYFLTFIVGIIFVAFIVGVFIMFQSDLHKILNAGGAKRLLVKRSASLKVKDESLLFTELNKSILELSESKTGAIIVIERDVNLQNFIDDGISVRCPVKAEVLNSIFYEGTPLHDGALIIRGITIEAAHVFVTPTTKALQGHYGARHRAAVGISEISDALVIVVSEETGRISFVEHGSLNSITRDRFSQVLSDKLSAL